MSIKRYTVIYLIQENPEAHGVFEDHERYERKVYAVMRSVGMRETYEAMGHGIAPERVFDLAIPEEYRDEKFLRWDGKLYKIVRTYLNGETLSLTCERGNERDLR